MRISPYHRPLRLTAVDGILFGMKVRVIPFGVLKDRLSAAEVELPQGATVAQLLEDLGRKLPAASLQGIAVGVNAEYATASHVLREGDEVGLLPPVSGGSDTLTTNASGEDSTGVVFLTRDVIEADKLVAASKHGEDGAVVVFDGIVRNNSRGRRTLYLDYEAYEEMALRQMKELASEARSRFGVRYATIAHRLGRLEIGETSVLIVVASAHRGQAYEASRWVIDTLKKTVPIWKKEIFVDGAVWADGEPFPAEIALAPAEVPRNE